MFCGHVKIFIRNMDFIQLFPNSKTVRFIIHTLFPIWSKKRSIEVRIRSRSVRIDSFAIVNVTFTNPFARPAINKIINKSLKINFIQHKFWNVKSQAIKSVQRFGPISFLPYIKLKPNLPKKRSPFGMSHNYCTCTVL